MAHANILQIIPLAESRTLYDYNQLLFNPSTGNFQPATFLETIPGGSLAENSGDKTSFLFDLVAPPPPPPEDDD